MTVNNNIVKRFPLLSKILHKLGILERRRNLPDIHRDSEINFILGFIFVVVAVTAFTGWVMTDNYKQAIVEQASFANPTCESISIIDKNETDSLISYTVDACGDVKNYLVTKSFSR